MREGQGAAGGPRRSAEHRDMERGRQGGVVVVAGRSPSRVWAWLGLADPHFSQWCCEDKSGEGPVCLLELRGWWGVCE